AETDSDDGDPVGDREPEEDQACCGADQDRPPAPRAEEADLGIAVLDSRVLIVFRSLVDSARRLEEVAADQYVQAGTKQQTGDARRLVPVRSDAVDDSNRR